MLACKLHITGIVSRYFNMIMEAAVQIQPSSNNHYHHSFFLKSNFSHLFKKGKLIQGVQAVLFQQRIKVWWRHNVKCKDKRQACRPHVFTNVDTHTIKARKLKAKFNLTHFLHTHRRERDLNEI